MRVKPADSVVAVGFLMLAAGLSMAAIVEPVGKNTTVTLRRGSTNITSTVLAEACTKVPTCSLTSFTVTVANCEALKAMLIDADGRDRTTGSNVYQCIVANQSIVKFKAAPIVLPPVDCVVSGWGAWSDPAWMACAGGQQTRALVHYRTIVTQPANGGAACPALVETVTETRPCPGIVTLSWTPTPRNVDGTTLTDLAGYRIVYGASASALVQTIQLANPGVSRYVIENLSPGVYYFAVRAYTTVGTESDPSNITSKIVL